MQRIKIWRGNRDSDWLRAGRSGDRIPVEARFYAPVQTGSDVHPASCTMGSGSFPGVKRPGRGVDHPPPSSAEVKERVKVYLYSSSGPSWPVLWWTLPLPFTIKIWRTLNVLVQIINQCQANSKQDVTDVMERSPSRKINCSSASQEILSILWDPRVRHRVHNSPLLVPVLSQIIPVHASPSSSYLLNIQICIICISM